MQLDRPRKRHPLPKLRETNLYELLRVQGPVKVPAGREWGRNNHPSSITCLPNVEQVDPPGDFPYQHRRQPLSPQLLVNAQEVDLNHGDPILSLERQVFVRQSESPKRVTMAA